MAVGCSAVASSARRQAPVAGTRAVDTAARADDLCNRKQRRPMSDRLDRRGRTLRSLPRSRR